MVRPILPASSPARADDPPAPRALLEATPTIGPSKVEYQARRKALMEQLKAAEAGATAMRSAMLGGRGEAGRAPGAAGVVVVMVGGGEPEEDAKFRQDNDFAYLTGRRRARTPR